MQCSRCYSGGSTEWRSKRRSRRGIYGPTPTSHGYAGVSIGEVSGGSMGFESTPPEADSPPRRFEFFHQYSTSLVICAVTGAFCAAVLFFLTFSVLHVGVAAFSFLSIFVLGLLMCIGLPVKMYKEYVVLSAPLG